MNNFDWAEDIDLAVTVCDTKCTVVYQNKRSRETFGKDENKSMVGQSMIPCHSERSVGIIHKMLGENVDNVYTITKQGRKKLIFQTPWRVGGEVRGLVELSMVLPEGMPHYDRDKK